MKKTMMLLSFSVVFIATYAQGIRFEQNLGWEQLKQKAKQEHKLIFLDLYATWCGPCKKMDEEVYTNDSLGEYMNGKFIAAKLQVDTTAKDNESIKNAYAFAHAISKEYKVSAVPTYLFFDADGKLLHRSEGFNSAEKFAEICETAQDPSKRFMGMLSKYCNGELQGNDLFNLAQDLKRFQEDSLAVVVALKCKESYLDKIKPKDILTPEFLQFFINFSTLYSSNEPLIRYIFLHQEEAGKAVNDPGFPQRMIGYYAWKEILNPALLTPDGKEARTPAPSWKSLNKKIEQSWDKATANQYLVKAQAFYYGKIKDYKKQAKYEIENIEINGLPKPGDVLAAMGINQMVWRVIFEHSEDPKVVKKGLSYMEYILKIDPDHYSWIDTYANLLYKSGEKQKAIEFERRALALAQADKNATKQDVDEYRITLSKMEQGLPTWENNNK